MGQVLGELPEKLQQALVMQVVLAHTRYKSSRSTSIHSSDSNLASTLQNFALNPYMNTATPLASGMLPSMSMTRVVQINGDLVCDAWIFRRIAHHEAGRLRPERMFAMCKKSLGLAGLGADGWFSHLRRRGRKSGARLRTERGSESHVNPLGNLGGPVIMGMTDAGALDWQL
eukprot:1957543-Rhodomonas_salina.1